MLEGHWSSRFADLELGCFRFSSARSSALQASNCSLFFTSIWLAHANGANLKVVEGTVTDHPLHAPSDVTVCATGGSPSSPHTLQCYRCGQKDAGFSPSIVSIIHRHRKSCLILIQLHSEWSNLRTLSHFLTYLIDLCPNLSKSRLFEVFQALYLPQSKWLKHASPVELAMLLLLSASLSSTPSLCTLGFSM